MARGAVAGAGLVEEFELGASEPAPGPRPHPPERGWLWGVAAAVLVTLGVLSAPPPSPTDGLNLVASLAAPPALAWEAPVTITERPSPRLEAELVGDAVAVTTDAGVTGFDAATGALRWEVLLDRPRCTYQEQVVCVTGRGWSAEVVTLDPRSGAVDVVALPSAAWALRLDGDVLALLYSRRTQTVVRMSGDDVVWATEVPYQPGIGGAARGYPFARIDDRLYVGTAGPAVLDVATGITLARPLQLRYDEAGIFGLGFNETWWHLWSGEQVTLAEGAARLAVDDDLDARTSVLVSHATGITVLRDGPAEPHWAGAGGESPLARLDGVLVTATPYQASTHGIDLATGAQLWESELMSCPCLGSGGTLLVSSSTTVPAGLTAIDVHTGRPQWQLAFPPATHVVDLVPGGVVVAGTDRVLLYRW